MHVAEIARVANRLHEAERPERGLLLIGWIDERVAHRVRERLLVGSDLPLLDGVGLGARGVFLGHHSLVEGERPRRGGLAAPTATGGQARKGDRDQDEENALQDAGSYDANDADSRVRVPWACGVDNGPAARCMGLGLRRGDRRLPAREPSRRSARDGVGRGCLSRPRDRPTALRHSLPAAEGLSRLSSVLSGSGSPAGNSRPSAFKRFFSSFFAAFISRFSFRARSRANFACVCFRFELDAIGSPFPFELKAYHLDRRPRRLVYTSLAGAELMPA